MNPKSILLVSPVSALANGGTAAYFRNLGDELVRHGHHVQGVSRILSQLSLNLKYWQTDSAEEYDKESLVEFAGWKNYLVHPKRLRGVPLRLIHRLLWRPKLQGVAIKLFVEAYQSSMEKVLDETVGVVHYIGTGAELFGFAALRIARERGARFTVTPFVHPGEWGDGSVDIRFYNQCDSVFVCTELERQHLMSVGVESSRLVKTPMAPSGILDADSSGFRARFEIGERPMIFFLARRQRYKGFHALCQAMELVIERVPEVVLVVAGPDGEMPYPSVPQRNFLDLGELTSKQDHRQLKADALGACDVYCMPSIAEAFGLVYAEAWAYGKPVIGGLAPALGELIEEGVDGYRVSQDPSEIAERLVALLTGDANRLAMGKRGREKQLNNYTWESVIQHHCDAWNQQ